jgi:hypothetical protein
MVDSQKHLKYSEPQMAPPQNSSTLSTLLLSSRTESQSPKEFCTFCHYFEDNESAFKG